MNPTGMQVVRTAVARTPNKALSLVEIMVWSMKLWSPPL